MATVHSLPIQVRYGDTDALGHINNAAYASYGEVSRLAFFSSLAGADRPQDKPPIDPDNPAAGVILAHLSIDYRQQVRFGQVVRVDTTVADVGRSSITLRQVVRADGGTAAEMRAVLVVFDYDAQTSRPVPAALRETLTAYRSD